MYHTDRIEDRYYRELERLEREEARAAGDEDDDEFFYDLWMGGQDKKELADKSDLEAQREEFLARQEEENRRKKEENRRMTNEYNKTAEEFGKKHTMKPIDSSLVKFNCVVEYYENHIERASIINLAIEMDNGNVYTLGFFFLDNIKSELAGKVLDTLHAYDELSRTVTRVWSYSSRDVLWSDKIPRLDNKKVTTITRFNRHQ